MPLARPSGTVRRALLTQEPNGGTLRPMAVSRRMAGGVAALVWAALLTGCSGRAGEDCGDSGGCVPSFERSGVQYAVGCLGVTSARLGPALPEVRVSSTGAKTPLRAIEGWSPEQALAVQVPTAGCGNAGDGASEWTLAFPLLGPASWSEQERIACDVGLAGPQARKASGCGSRQG